MLSGFFDPLQLPFLLLFYLLTHREYVHNVIPRVHLNKYCFNHPTSQDIGRKRSFSIKYILT